MALNTILMKCFKKLPPRQIKYNITSLDPHQFAFRAKRSTEDASSSFTFTQSSHTLKITYVRLLFVDVSSTVSKISPLNLIGKLNAPGLSTPLCNWILNFLKNRTQSLCIGSLTSSTSVECRSPPSLCAQLPPPHTIHPLLQSQT